MTDQPKRQHSEPIGEFSARWIKWHEDKALAPTTPPAAEPGAPLQERVQPWLVECFGPEISADTKERNHRFLEESIELVQACGCTVSEAHQLVDYVFARPVGEPDQEVGGVMITLAALCLANGLDMHEAGERELARIWTMVEKIRAKQAAKPKHSPLPEQAGAPSTAQGLSDAVMVPLAFVQGFNTLAHNYSLKANAPDFYRGTEADAFSNAYRRCGEDLAKLRAILAAKETK